MRYHLPYENLPNNSKSAVQLAIERLNSLPYRMSANLGVNSALFKPGATAVAKLKAGASLGVTATPKAERAL
jgi:hypothetical protein